MTGADDERLATLRSGSYANYPYNREEDRIFLLRLLGEARAERDQQTTLADQCQTTIAELHAPYWPMSITEKLAELEAELSRLRSPSSADMVERARTLATSALANLWLILPDAEFSKAVVQVAATIEFVEREAREAARTALLNCAKYDALMEGPQFKGWDRSALDRLRQQYESGTAPQAGWRPIDTAPKSGKILTRRGSDIVVNWWIRAMPGNKPGFNRDGWAFIAIPDWREWHALPASPPTEDTKP